MLLELIVTCAYMIHWKVYIHHTCYCEFRFRKCRWVLKTKIWKKYFENFPKINTSLNYNRKMTTPLLYSLGMKYNYKNLAVHAIHETNILTGKPSFSLDIISIIKLKKGNYCFWLSLYIWEFIFMIWEFSQAKTFADMIKV